jgi:UDP-N-acetylmuramoyl-L-alanyl-D-glutamate--2,6-diaminopimelate ligase
MALDAAGPGDLVLIAGKGHEDYQIVGTERRHFSDAEVVQQWNAGAGEKQLNRMTTA